MPPWWSRESQRIYDCKKSRCVVASSKTCTQNINRFCHYEGVPTNKWQRPQHCYQIAWRFFLHCVTWTPIHYVRTSNKSGEIIHGADYISAYENEIACKNFIIEISDYLLNERLKKRLELVNFISILCGGSTNKCHWTRTCFRGVYGAWNTSTINEIFWRFCPKGQPRTHFLSRTKILRLSD